MSSAPNDGFLLAYFLSEKDPEGEQIRFAISVGAEPTSWIPIDQGRPVLRSSVGEQGVRDPFLVRDAANGRILLIATDLRVWPDNAWERAVRWGSRSVVIWETTDLIEWSAPRLVEVAPSTAGNAWAPKAYWSAPRECWLLFFASALYGSDAREDRQYQRMMVAETDDFCSFRPAAVYLDRGHDVIDSAFVEHRGRWHRFSADAAPCGDPLLGGAIFHERGHALDDPRYASVAAGLGRPELERGEGPAVATSLDGERVFLLIDEFGLRGYQLFESSDLDSGEWSHRDAALPAGARHGSLLAISSQEIDRLMAGT